MSSGFDCRNDIVQCHNRATKFCIICYVAPSMFMTANSSSSKLYVNLYVSFMTPGAHEMSGNAISRFPGARAPDTTLGKKISF